MSESKSIGALWLHTSKDGTKKYMAGNIELPDKTKVKFVVFKNTNKKSEKHPDYNILLSEPMAKKTDTAQMNAPDDDDDDSIPF